jgi:hypothetical protein
MEMSHYLLLAIVLIAGYVLGRMWDTPAQMTGLP